MRLQRLFKFIHNFVSNIRVQKLDGTNRSLLIRLQVSGRLFFVDFLIL
jgi:hypothetical protein